MHVSEPACAMLELIPVAVFAGGFVGLHIEELQHALFESIGLDSIELVVADNSLLVNSPSVCCCLPNADQLAFGLGVHHLRHGLGSVFTEQRRSG
jgi:hypothetical protein